MLFRESPKNIALNLALLQRSTVFGIMQYDWGGNTEDLLFGIDNIRIQKIQ